MGLKLRAEGMIVGNTKIRGRSVVWASVMILAILAFAMVDTVIGFNQAGNVLPVGIQNQGIRITVSPQQASRHPRLLITAGELRDFKQKIEDNNPGHLGISYREYFSQLRKKADILVRNRWAAQLPVKFPSGNKAKKLGDNFSANLPLLALVYLLTGDSKYLDTAKMAMDKASRWDSWSKRYWPNPKMHGLDRDAITLGMSFSYDWVYNDITEEERARYGKAIIEKGIVPIYEASRSAEAFPFDHENAYYSFNHVIAALSALGIASIAVYGKDPVADHGLQEAVEKAHLFILKSGDRDGGYAEGLSYGEFAIRSVILLNDALKTSLGSDLMEEGDSNGWIKNSAYFMIYSMLPGFSGKLNFGDEAGQLFPPIAVVRATSKYSGEVAELSQWYLKNLIRMDRIPPSPFLFLYLNPYGKVADIGRIKNYRYFRDIGWVTFYSELGNPHALFFAFKSGNHRIGKYTNHVHYDNGHLVLFKQSHLLTDPGYRPAEFTEFFNPEWNIYAGGTFGHNSLIVDGYSQNERRGEIRSFFATSDYLHLSSESGDSYFGYQKSPYDPPDYTKKLLSSFNREIMLVSPRYIAVYDRVKTHSQPRNLALLFHGNRVNTRSRRSSYPDIEKATYRVSEDGFTIIPQDGQTRLEVKLIDRANKKIEVVTYPGATEYGQYVSVSTRSKVSEFENFCFMFPLSMVDQIPKVLSLKDSGFIGAKVIDRAMTDVVLVGDGSGITYEDMETDAHRIVVGRKEDHLIFYAFHDATYLKLKGAFLFMSDARVDASYRNDVITVATKKATRLKVYSAARRDLKEWVVEPGLRELDLAAP
jgi:hypothetical protein